MKPMRCWMSGFLMVTGLWPWGRATSAEVVEQWEVAYEAAGLPQDAQPPWTMESWGSSTDEAINGQLRVVDTPQGNRFYRRNWEALNHVGATVEVRLKVVACDQPVGVFLGISDDVHSETFTFYPDRVEGFVNQALRHTMDTADAFHVYRVTVRGDDLRLYVGGKLVIDGSGAYRGGPTNRICFGSGSSPARGEAFWDYVRYTTMGAFPPGVPIPAFDSDRKLALSEAERAARPVPRLGERVQAKILHDDGQLLIWLASPMRKVWQYDSVEPGRAARARPASPQVTIAAARNEYEAFQVVLRPKQPRKRKLQVDCTDLVSPHGRISRKHIVVNPVGYIRVTQPSDTTTEQFPQGFGGTGAVGYWPDLLLEQASIEVAEERNYPVWVTVYVPPGTPAGDYVGQLRASEGGQGRQRRVAEIALRLHVFSFSLPETPIARASAYWRPEEIKGTDKEALERFYRNFAAHRVAPTHLWPQPSVTFRGEEVVLDTAAFDEMARYCLDTLEMNSFFFPHIGLYGLPQTDLLRHQWFGVPIGDEAGHFTEDFRRRFRAYVRAMSQHLKAKGWFDKVVMATMDEPWSPEQYQVILRLVELIREAAPELKVFVTEEPVAALEGAINIWCPCQFTAERCRQRQQRGEEVWFYQNWLSLIDRPALNCRLFGWIMWRNNMDGVEFWDTMYNWATGNPLTYPTFVYEGSGRTLWGNGQLIYPNERWDGPLNSIRWELIRDGLEDYEYLHLLRRLCQELRGRPAARLTEKGRQLLGKAEGFLQRIGREIVPVYDWVNNRWVIEFTEHPECIEQARLRAAAFLEALGKRK